MPNPQQPELRRSRRGATEDASAKEHLSAEDVPRTSEDGRPVPEDNTPGHHPDHEQDKPVDRFARRAARVAEEAQAHQHAVREREIAVGELRFRALECGREGDELVLLLHGFPQLGHAWRSQLETLGSHGYHAVAPDQRGYSPQAQPRGVRPYRLPELVGDVLGMADELGARRFHLVGHDWGGIVAWAVAAAAPQRLESLTVVSTPHPRAYAATLLRSPQVLRSAYIGFFSLPLVPETVLGAAGGTLLRRMLGVSGLPAEQARRYADEVLERGALGPALSWYRALLFSGGLVGKIAVPTLYVWSDRDAALGGAAARATAEQVTGPYRFVVLPGVSHWIPETAPDELNSLLLEHLGAQADEQAGARRRAAPG